MSKWFFLLLMVITGNLLFAQNTLEIKGSGTGLYLEHKVSPKESLYSLGRLYNVPPKELASFNRLSMESGLSLGQEIKIPLNNNNFTQSEASNGETIVPLVHTVQPKETLYRLSVNYNKVPLANLKKWNHLASDNVSEGSQMIVGYLKVDKNVSALASGSRNSTNDVAVNKAAEKPADKPQPVADKPVAVKEPEPARVDNASTNQQNNQPATNVTSVNTKSNINFSGGFFKKQFEQQTASASPVTSSGTAGIFKSTSGWQDGKYYCFSNDAAPGSIVKVTENGSGKSVYAKVLDAIPDIKQNAGLALVLSNAAAEELGAGENKFDCTVSFVK
jgi:LysM repeat protein